MAKTVDLKAAKAAKQKKIAIGGAVLLVLVLGLSVPRTLKMMNHKPPTSTAAAQPTTQQPAPEVTPTAPSTSPLPATPLPASGTPVSQVLSAPLEAAAHDGQLSRLSPTFKTKDPFVQQMRVDSGTPSDSAESADVVTSQPKKQAGASPSAHASQPAVPAEKPTRPAVVPPADTPANTPAPNPTTSTPTAGPTAPTAAPTKPAAVPYVSATISVDGVEEGVNVKSDFPAASPLFHLVSATKKTAVITIAGGSLANGAPTLTLRIGKAVTLMNTADGTRYKVVLVATSTAPAAPPTATPGGASGATGPATTTATQTTGG